MNQVSGLRERLKEKQDDLEEIKTKLYSVASPGTGERRSSRGDHWEKKARLIQRKDELENEIIDLTLALIESKKDLAERIENSKCSEKRKDLLIDRYVLGLSPAATAEKHGYKIRQYYKMQHKALEEFEGGTDGNRS